MGATVFGKKKRRKGEPPRAPLHLERPAIPASALFRMFVLGSISVIACVWAIWRHFAVPRPPMLVPVPATSTVSSPGGGEGEIEIETTP